MKGTLFAEPESSVLREWLSASTVPPRLSVSEWADAHRKLPETSAYRGARWRTSHTPYLRGIMDAVHEPGVTKIAVMGGAQVGKSESLHNILGYFVAHDPCPTLFVHPSKDVAEEWSKDRLDDMLFTTDVLRDVVDESKSTLTYKVFPGGYLALGGANTPNTFARRAARLVIGDDVDRFPAVVGDEGDPADLLENRTRTFLDGLVLFVSTPTLKNGRIDTLFSRSDQRRFFLACPSCGRQDWLTWNDPTHFRIAFDGDDPETARRAMVADGYWQPTATPAEVGLIGFHLPTLVSTLGDVTLSRLVEKWLAARGRGKESLRVFINTILAEAWEDRGARMDPQRLTDRREDYGAGVEVPEGAVALTAGVDVQENRFELSVVAWGHAGERWLIDHRALPGDPKLPETRRVLLEALSRKYTHALGPLLPIHAACVDTGYATEHMYDFVLAYQARRIFATKGFASKGGEPIVGKPAEKRYGRQARPVRLFPINVDDAKSDVMSALAQTQAGPNCFHFPLHLDTVDEEYFAQLCAEHKETRYNRQHVATHVVWVLDRERNEALDCAVLALAAFRLLNPNIRQMLEALRAAAHAPALVSSTPDNVPAPPTPAPPSTSRRVSRSSYLQR